MKRRVELAVVLVTGIGLGVGLSSAAGLVRAAAPKGVKVSAQGKAALIDVSPARDSVFVAAAQRRGAGSATVPLVQVMGPGRTRICTSNLAGPLYVFEMRASLVFDRLNWNECTPQLCVDPHGLLELGRVVDRPFRGEVCGNGRDDDDDSLVDSNDPDCQC